jgi:ATP-dependent RNA helicase RhlE
LLITFSQLSCKLGSIEAVVSKKFSDLPIIPEIQSALEVLQYVTPTPIQAGAIPPLLEGKDLLGCAQTGTGKTAAFAIPLLQKIHQIGKHATPYQPLGLIIAPTRELVVQISENISAIGKRTKVRHMTIYGGVGQRPQVAALAKGSHVVVATPGRLLDLIEQQYCNLSKVQFFVLDEADRMLDMGFMPDVKKIVRLLPQKRQSVFLSATMPAPIAQFASTLLHDHVTVMVTPPSRTADRVKQSVMYVEKSNKRKLLDRLLSDASRTRVLVFMRTKHGADRLYKSLIDAGVSAEGIHGGRSQNARQRVLNAFRDGKVRVLVATDVAARGIDIDEISHVINYDVPVEAEAYVHRIGRTARAGASGESITFCDGEEYKYLQEIEKTIGMAIPVDRDHPFHSVDAGDHELRSYGESAKGKASRGGKSKRPRGPGARHSGGGRDRFETRNDARPSAGPGAGSSSRPSSRPGAKSGFGKSFRRKPAWKANTGSSSGSSSGPATGPASGSSFGSASKGRGSTSRKSKKSNSSRSNFGGPKSKRR